MSAETRMAHMTQMEVGAAIEAGKLVILPTGATEAHGPHMPTDTDSHQAEYIAVEMAKRLDAVVAPVIPYGISKTFENFPGTLSLSIPVYQELVYEVASALVKMGFRNLLILNGNRPNGTSNDAVARRLQDDLDEEFDFMVTAVSYWEPGAEAVHALRTSPVGGMGHAGEFETSFQLATRPELVHMERLEGVHAPLVAWDLVAPMVPVRTYARRPRPQKGHAAIFGYPFDADGERGKAFIAAVVDAMVALMQNVSPSYEERKP
jgi:creatinine amidohydrolase